MCVCVCGVVIGGGVNFQCVTLIIPINSKIGSKVEVVFKKYVITMKTSGAQNENEKTSVRSASPPPLTSDSVAFDHTTSINHVNFSFYGDH